MLNNLDFKLQYRSSDSNIYEDFYYPCLKNSVSYDRASGYFTSESFKLLARGLEVFLENGGKIRIVANPKLSEDDIEAIEKGHIAKEEIIEENLLKEIKLGYKTIEDDTLNVISWLIFKEQLEFKIAFTKGNAIYHEKFGVFTDETGYSIAFSGSANETYYGLRENFEKIDVYSDIRDIHRIENSKSDFDNLWHNRTRELEVMDMPDSINRELISYRKDIEKYNLYTSKSEKQKTDKVEERDYQKIAINNWINNQNIGILEMATGTGKTITSLLAAKRFKKNQQRALIIIIVPFQHLIEQWSKDVESILDIDVLKCMNSKQTWFNKAKKIVQEYNLGLIDEQVFLTTYKTASSVGFKNIFNRMIGPSLLICDECHSLTYNGYRDFPFDKFNGRLGLSATPDRWWDEEGTFFIKNSVGDVVYQYDLDQAIENDKLTPYEYYPHIVNFSEKEMSEYNKISMQIFNLLKKDSDEEKEKLERLYSKRANLIYKAENKIPQFIQDIKEEDLPNLKHTLVYCAPGEIDIIVKKLYELGLKVSKFNAEIKNKEREKLLKMFDEGQIQVLVAIRCLDEGVDIPATRSAYFLASTSNPKEFIQRRGRILRKHTGKRYAKLHDYIVLPLGLPFDDFNKIASKELPRFTEFSNSALNYSKTKLYMGNILNDYNLSHLMYKKPWEVYKEMKEMFENGNIK